MHFSVSEDRTIEKTKTQQVKSKRKTQQFLPPGLAILQKIPYLRASFKIFTEFPLSYHFRMRNVLK